ncbi:MAG: class I SAM-dependent methyltransferase [Trueperaceae bacterium]|nr:class I SAM-dependent methyltransferase [Trueperaceae bacterium]
MSRYLDGYAYETDDEHRVAPGEAALIASALAAALGSSPAACDRRLKVLDFGAGTGLLTVALKAAGYEMIGIDPAPSMVQGGLRLHPELTVSELVVYDEAAPTPFAPAFFDAITSRQVLCHLESPAAVFDAWWSWLRPGGGVAIVDGYWPHTSWKPEALSRQPFASLANTDPVRAALESSGFLVDQARSFSELDALRRAAFGSSRGRYLVTARKPLTG